MSAPKASIQVIQAEIAALAAEMNQIIDDVIGAVPADAHADEFQSECFRDALKKARNHRLALESLSRHVEQLFGGAS